MDNKTIRSILRDALEKEIPASEIQMWSTVRATLVAEGNTSFQSGEKVIIKPHRTSHLAVVTLAIIALLAFAFLTPQGRAFAQSILQFFVRADSDTLPTQPFQLTPVSRTVTPDPGYIFDQSIVDAGQRAGFTVLVPTSLPKILSFEGASYEPDHNIVRIFYSYAGTTNGLVIREERFQTNDDCELCGVVGPSAKIEALQVGNVTGEYVEGVWNLTNKGPVWISDSYLKTLRWQENNMAFEIMYMGPPEEVTKNDLVAIATSLK